MSATCIACLGSGFWCRGDCFDDEKKQALKAMGVLSKGQIRAIMLEQNGKCHWPWIPCYVCNRECAIPWQEDEITKTLPDFWKDAFVNPEVGGHPSRAICDAPRPKNKDCRMNARRSLPVATKLEQKQELKSKNSESKRQQRTEAISKSRAKPANSTISCSSNAVSMLVN